MGTKLWSGDMIVNDMIRPMFNAYQFKDYETACNLLFQFNNFLLGFGNGITDLPQAEYHPTTTRERRMPDNYYKNYYERYSPLLMKKVGKYIQDVLVAIAAERDYI